MFEPIAIILVYIGIIVFSVLFKTVSNTRVKATNGKEIAINGKYCNPIFITSASGDNILNVKAGKNNEGIKKIKEAANEKKHIIAVVFAMFSSSFFPQNCDKNIDPPLVIPNKSNMYKKNTLLDSPTAAIDSSPSLPIIIVSIKLTLVDISC